MYVANQSSWLKNVGEDVTELHSPLSFIEETKYLQDDFSVDVPASLTREQAITKLIDMDKDVNLEADLFTIHGNLADALRERHSHYGKVWEIELQKVTELCKSLGIKYFDSSQNTEEDTFKQGNIEYMFAHHP